MNKDICSLSW